ncbi:MAG: A/G-specific adenine glycosylase [Holdemanella sp.]|nr:A/G-specific adenine glycosylase [Holdemanella sp.]
MFQYDLLSWYEKNARELEFRKNKDAYGIWISEIMAQQTRIEAMLAYYARFMKELPDIQSLSEVDDEKLNKLWQGLGYYSRARNLKKCAIICMEEYNGKLPSTKKELMKLPGIGNYTAGAIASIAFDEKVSAVDGNVIRVFSRLYNIDEDVTSQKVKKRIENLVDDSLVESRDISHYNQALMELGALICIPQNPRCEQCPIKKYCQAYKQDTQNRLPILKKKKERKIIQKTIYIYTYKNKIHIHKRSDKGLLAGLYEFDEDLINESNIINKVQIPSYTHIFSHVEWHMDAYMIEVKEEFDGFVHIETIEKEYAIPSAFAPFFKEVKGRLS